MAPLIIIILIGVKGTNKDGTLGTSYPTTNNVTSEMRFDAHIPVALQEESTGTHDDSLVGGRSTIGREKHTAREYAV